MTDNKLPRIGLRIIKSAIAVELCFLVSFLRGNSGMVIYSQLSALWCMQEYASQSKQNGWQRFRGTLIGAAFGLLFLLLERKWNYEGLLFDIGNSILICLMLVVILYTTAVLLKKKEVSNLSCVVFLSIVIGRHPADLNSYLYVWNRFLDTMIGILIGIGVNMLTLPKEKKNDTLFISRLDQTLLTNRRALSDYSKIELNRMLEEGLNFTISTLWTPAALIESLRDVHLRLPVIAMDGAVLYDIQEKMYLKTYVISSELSRQVLELISQNGLTCFTNVVIDDMLVIYYEELKDPKQQALFEDMRRSPYRNYVKRPLPKQEYVVYFSLLYPWNVIGRFYKILEKNGITKELKVIKYDAEEYQGYCYLKIFNKNATVENMIAYLKEELSLEKAITFGNKAGMYDYVVDTQDSNAAVHLLKKLYEPIKLPGRKTKERNETDGDVGYL